MAMIQLIDEKPEISKLKTEFIIRNEPNQVRTMVMEGNIDFAVLPTTTAALLYNKGENYILAAIPIWGTLYLFGKDTSIHSWNDLRGKRISLMAKGMTPDVLFRFLAAKNGIDPDKDISIDYSFPTHIELANAIISGNSDLGVISEPLVTMVMQKNPEIKPLIDLNAEWVKVFGESVPFAQTALLVKKELADKSPELVDEYLLKLQQSVTWVNSNPEQAARLIVKYDILPDSVLALRYSPL
jgi:NitT/TauT family transport system substrate-binding protein